MPEQYASLVKEALAAGATVSFRSTPLPFAGRIRRVVVKHDANPSGASTFDINVGGVSIFAAPGDRPSVAAGATETVIEGLSAPHVENAVLSVDADAVPLGGLTNVSVLVVSDDMLGDKPVPIEFFVRAMYLGVLGREPSSPELTAAETALAEACFGFTFIDAARDLADELFGSDEFADLETTDEEFVTALYHGYLNREPEAGGLANWTAAITSSSRAAVRAAFHVSTEFTNRAPLFCRSQAPVADATSIQGNDPAEFVRDTIASANTDSGDVDFSANDPANTLTATLKTTGVAAGEYGDATHIPVITVDEKGRVTEVEEVEATGGGGDATQIRGRAVENFGAIPANFGDDFNDNSFDAFKWSRSSTTFIVEQNARMELTGAGGHFFQTAAAKNFVGKSVQFRVSAPAGASIWARIFLNFSAATDNWFEMRFINGSNFTCASHVGSDTVHFAETYSETTHAWAKFEHDNAANLIRFYTAPDASGSPGAWTQKATWTPSLTPSSIRLNFYSLAAGTGWVDSITSTMLGEDNIQNGAALVYNSATQQFEDFKINQVEVVTSDPSGTPAGILTGYTIMRFNVTNNKLWIWNTSSSAWKSVTFA